MTTKKILVPIDGTERSMHSLNFIKENYSPDKVELHIINVKELVFIDGISMSDEIKTSEKNGRELLDKLVNLRQRHLLLLAMQVMRL